MSRKVADVYADLSQFKRDLVERLDRVEKTMEIMREEAKARHEEARKHHEEAEKRHAELMALLVKLLPVSSPSLPLETANARSAAAAPGSAAAVRSAVTAGSAAVAAIGSAAADIGFLGATTTTQPTVATLPVTLFIIAAVQHNNHHYIGCFSVLAGQNHEFSGLWGHAKHWLTTWLEQNSMFQPILQFHYDQQAIDFQVRIWDPGIT